MVLGTNGKPQEKEWSWTFTPSLTKTNSKDQCKTNARLKSIKLLEENTVVNLCDPGLGNGFLNMTPKAQVTLGQINLEK